MDNGRAVGPNPREGVGVSTGDDDLFELFDDLEDQAEAMYDDQRRAELDDRSRAEYAGVTFASRLLASVDRPVVLRVRGIDEVSGVLSGVGSGWCRISGLGREWVVALSALQTVAGLSPRSVPEEAWPATARLGLGAALRRLDPQRIHLDDGTAFEGELVRVGADFVELRTPPATVVVPFAGLAAALRREM